MKILAIFIGIAIAVGLVLLVIAVVGRLLWSTSRGGKVERLAKMADKQLALASKASAAGRHGLVEDHMKLYNTLIKQIESGK